MLRVDLRDAFDDIAADIGTFDERELKAGAARALNAAARGAVTDASRAIRERFRQLRLADVNPSFSVTPARPDDLVATVTVRGRPLSLARFLAGAITDRGKGGVWVNVKGERKFIPHVWAQAMKNKQGEDYIVLMARVGKERYPVKVLKTIDIPGAFTIPEILAYVEEQTDIRFDKAAVRNLTYLEGQR